MSRQLLGLSTVVITEPLRRWIVFESLSRIFAEAFNLQLNTRFQGKWKEYQNEAKSAAEFCFQSGIGIVFSALREPALPLVSVSNRFSESGCLVRANHVGGRQGCRERTESSKRTDSYCWFQHFGRDGRRFSHAPAAAVGWNLYIAVDQSVPTRQTIVPSEIGSTWQLPAGGIVIGSALGQGQMPNFYIRTSKQILRG